jgi:hypothetical protein
LVEQMRQAKTGMRYSGDVRERMRQGQMERYAREGRWTADMDALRGAVSDCKLARRWGLTPTAVCMRRRKLKVTAWRERGGRRPAKNK